MNLGSSLELPLLRWLCKTTDFDSMYVIFKKSQSRQGKGKREGLKNNEIMNIWKMWSNKWCNRKLQIFEIFFKIKEDTCIDFKQFYTYATIGKKE